MIGMNSSRSSEARASATNEIRRARQVVVGLACIGAAAWALSYVRYPLDGWVGSALAVGYGHDTEYAPGYSEKEFARLELGMTMNEVERRLGRPLQEYAITGGELGWRYTRSPRDMSYRVRVVIFKSGVMSHGNIRTIHSGASRKFLYIDPSL